MRSHLPRTTFDRLMRAGTRYHREAARCLRGKAYFAASVMQVAVLEAELRALCSIYARDVRKTAVYQKKRFRRKRDRALEFTLYQLINVARELNWFPSRAVTWGGRRTDLAGFAQEIREIRNLVHPDRMAKGMRDQIKFSKKTFGIVYEVFDVANSWLRHRVETDILKAAVARRMAGARCDAAAGRPQPRQDDSAGDGVGPPTHRELGQVS